MTTNPIVEALESTVELLQVDSIAREKVERAIPLARAVDDLVKALEQYADRNNWGYFDDSGCRKGIGVDKDACFIGTKPAEEALTQYRALVSK